jgi:hypothetical protein
MKLPEPKEPLQGTPREPKPQPRSETPPALEGQRSVPRPEIGSRPAAIQASGKSNPPASKTPSQPTGKGINPGKRLRAVERAAKNAKPPKLPLKYRLKPNRQKVHYAFWNVASGLSLFVNIILIAVLILMSREIFSLKRMVVGNLLGGLYTNIGKMDEAHIKTTIQVQTDLAVDFPLQINQLTEVTLTQDTPISGARVSLTSGGLNILSAPTNILLPKGTTLPIQLNMTVPVSATIPVALPVTVDIPLAETDLHEPFTNLRNTVIGPYLITFWGGPYNWQDVPACKVLSSLCEWWFR